MKRVASKVARQAPPIAWRERKISRLEADLRRLQGKVGWNESERQRLEQRLTRSLRRVEKFREKNENLRHLHAQLNETVAERTEELRAAEAAHTRDKKRLEGPSFLTLLAAYREFYDLRFEAETLDGIPMWQMPYKLRNYALAQSHGISTPNIHQVWGDPEDIDLSSIPAQRIVLKSDGGHSGHGVFVLERSPSGWTTLDGLLRFEGQKPAPEILERFAEWHGPYFAEEFLESTTGALVPEDIKVYTMYGEPQQILLMQADEQGSMSRKEFTRRYLGPQGDDLGKVAEMGTHNPDISAPENLEEISETARHLSRAAGMPFVRVDLYQTPRGLVLGELTPTPGGRQRYRREHDEKMGRAWIRAEVRLQQDLAAGRPLGSLYGRKKYTWWYDGVLTSQNGTSPDTWERTHRPCNTWCY
ncbi:hypothetical protein GCM10028800_05690 [Nesterenkonia populi]